MKLAPSALTAQLLVLVLAVDILEELGELLRSIDVELRFGHEKCHHLFSF